MRVILDAAFLKKLKKLDVRIRKSFKEKITTFAKNPYDPQLNNHELKDEYMSIKDLEVLM